MGMESRLWAATSRASARAAEIVWATTRAAGRPIERVAAMVRVAGAPAAATRETGRPIERVAAHALPTFTLIAVALATLLVFLLLPADRCAASPLSTEKKQAQAEARALMKEIGALNGQLKTAGGRLSRTRQLLRRAKARAAANEAKLRETTELLAADRQQLAERAVAIYKRPESSMLGLVLGAESFQSIVVDLDLMKRIGAADAKLVSDVQAALRDLEIEQSRLDSERTRAAQLLDQAKAQQTEVKATLKARRRALGDAKAKVRRIMRRIAVARAAARARAASLGRYPVTASGAYTQESWARALLRNARLPITDSNVAAIVAWEMAEGGHWFNTAHYNPLNTTMSAPGATPMNSVGVKAYTSWAQGFSATLATLYNGLYKGIIAALKAGNDGQAVANAVAASPWGTGPFTVR